VDTVSTPPTEGAAMMDITKLSDEQRTELREALALVAVTQSAFWDALSTFERLAETDINDHNDFVNYADATDEDVAFVIETAQGNET
jgi:hypothetical protein